MKLRNIVALVAIVGLTAQAHAADVLRRTETVAQVETTTTAPVAAPATSTTVEVKTVEAKPVEVKATEVKATEVKTVETKIVETPVETKAAAKAAELRKARVGEEVSTESKIVEKLESERLQEEMKRAERLFSEKTPEKVEKAEPVAAPVAPTVRIDKVEIVQPQQIVAPAPVTPVVVAAPVVAPAPAKTEAAPGAVALAEQTPSVYKWYVGGLLAIPEYNDSKVKTNYGLGGTVGVMVDEDFAFEGSFIYSNYNIQNNNSGSSYGYGGGYGYGGNGMSGRREMDQYEVKATFKWYALRSLLGDARLKPYIGGSASYIYREYSRSNNNSMYSDYSYGSYGSSGQNSTQTTDAANLGALIGADVMITPHFAIGAAFEYSHPIMSNSSNNQNNNSDYANPYGNFNGSNRGTRVESWDFTTISLNAKFTF